LHGAQDLHMSIREEDRFFDNLISDLSKQEGWPLVVEKSKDVIKKNPQTESVIRNHTSEWLVSKHGVAKVYAAYTVYMTQIKADQTQNLAYN
jgi:hypothetical protein